jgi:hypothetical protein
MGKKKFTLVAEVESDRPQAIKPALEKAVGAGTIEPIPRGFRIKAIISGESARDLNRDLLSALRHAERKTRLRAQWTSVGVTERFFDYVPKGRTSQGDKGRSSEAK